MTDGEFDTALITSAFALAGREGWRHLSLAAAAREAGLDLARARARYPGRGALLARFGVLADQAALAEASSEGSVRDRLFAIIMRRIDVLQAHRAGVLALLRALPTEPPTALGLALLSLRSMGWMLEAAGVEASGLRGLLRAKFLLGVWLWTLRAWRGDESEDLAATMAALDRALDRADRAAQLCGAGQSMPAAAKPPPPAIPIVSDPPQA